MSIAVSHRLTKDSEQKIESEDSQKLKIKQVALSNEDLEKRNAYFDKLYEKQCKEIQNKSKQPIEIVFKDQSDYHKFQGKSFETSPYEIISNFKKIASTAVIAKVKYSKEKYAKILENAAVSVEQDHAPSLLGEQTILWDLKRPFEDSCTFEVFTFDNAEAQQVFWHSSAHMLGEAMEKLYGSFLAVGPPLERGFYYDFYVNPAHTISEHVYTDIEKTFKSVVSENQEFQRLLLSKEEALEMFKSNPFKIALIKSKVPDNSSTTCYRCGTLIDLCQGPHIVSTGSVKGFSIEKHSGVYWLGDCKNEQLQRVYGISFPDEQRLKKYKQIVAEAKKRDHRVIGNQLQLFMFDTQLSPGSCLWLPHGAKIYNKLIELIRKEYTLRNFTEVITPNIYNCELFNVSGHLQNYKENMYCFEVENQEWTMKSMNCPGHCLMFRHMKPSYRQLPIRLADFGVLHRNELTGSLSGLTRVRRFQQDDGHIFCSMDQVENEIIDALRFVYFVYDIFGFNYDFKLSTRPKKALGGTELWNQAEAALAKALDTAGKPWSLNPGDGAFYGPKIDIRLQDASQRWHQCGTIQLDFQLPLRFDLQYRTFEEASKVSSNSKEKSDNCEDTRNDKSPIVEDLADEIKNMSVKKRDSWETPLKPGYGRPVIIHRAILGSIERMTAILLEHTAGILPFWLSPRQIFICSVTDKFQDYAEYVYNIFLQKGLNVFLDTSSSTINKKVRQARLERWNYIVVVGQMEIDSETVMIRDRDDPIKQTILSIKDALKLFKKLCIMPSSNPLHDDDDNIPPFKRT